MTPISDIAEAVTGYPFDSNLFNDSKGFPLIRIRNLKAGKTDTFYNGEFDETFIVKKGDLLIGMDGEFNLVEWNSNNALLNQRVMKVIPREKLVSKTYLKYALPKKLKEIEDATPFVTVKHLSHKKVLDSKIPLPDLKTQQKIASILEQADAARQKRKQANQLTEQFLQSTFLEMFGDPISNERKWEIKKGEEYCEKLTVGVVIKPASYYVEKGVIALRSLNIKPSRIVLDNLVYFSEEVSKNQFSKSVLREGDVVFVRTGVTGTAAIIPKVLDGCNCIDLIISRPKKNLIHPVYLSYFFNSEFGKKVVSSKNVGGIQQHFNIGALKNMSIPCPPFSLQQKFAALVEQVEHLRSKQRESERELDNLFNSLMQKYFG